MGRLVKQRIVVEEFTCDRCGKPIANTSADPVVTLRILRTTGKGKRGRKYGKQAFMYLHERCDNGTIIEFNKPALPEMPEGYDVFKAIAAGKEALYDFAADDLAFDAARERGLR